MIKGFIDMNFLPDTVARTIMEMNPCFVISKLQIFPVLTTLLCISAFQMNSASSHVDILKIVNTLYNLKYVCGLT